MRELGFQGFVNIVMFILVVGFIGLFFGATPAFAETSVFTLLLYGIIIDIALLFLTYLLPEFDVYATLLLATTGFVYGFYFVEGLAGFMTGSIIFWVILNTELPLVTLSLLLFHYLAASVVNYVGGLF